MIRAIASRAIRFALDGLQGPTNEQARENLEQRLSEAEARLTTAEAKRVACLDALSEHVSPAATADTPRMIRPSSVLAGIRSLQGRLRDARSDLRDHDAALEAAERRRSSEVTGLGQQLAEVVAQRDNLRARLETSERLHSEAEAHVECRNALRYRIRSLEADLAAARARIAELEAPMPEATVEELHIIGHYAQCAAANASPPEAVRAGIRAVAERVRRERPPCLIARAVAANIDVRVAEDVGGGFLVGIHRPGEDEHMVRNVPAAEVHAELARMLTEVGA